MTPNEKTLLGFEGCSSHSGRRTFVTKALAKASITMAPVDLWRARLALTSIPAAQRGPLVRVSWCSARVAARATQGAPANFCLPDVSLSALPSRDNLLSL